MATVDFDKFANNLDAVLASTTLGYGYAICSGPLLKRSNGGGLAVRPQDGGIAIRTASTRQFIGSISKVITAAATVKAFETLRALGSSASIDLSIKIFLPPAWKNKADPSVGGVSFRDLLMHKSGLLPVSTGGDGDPDLYVNLKKMIEKGVMTASPKYQDTNYSLLRVLLPRVIKLIPGALSAATIADLDSPLSEAIDYERTAPIFLAYLKQQILAPCGQQLWGVDVKPTGPAPYVRYYDVTRPNVAGLGGYEGVNLDAGLERHRMGAGWWYMSAVEFALIIAGLRNGKVFPPSFWQSMQGTAWQRGLGMLVPLSGANGLYQWHNGIFTSADGRGERTCWMAYPDGVTAVYLASSAPSLTPNGSPTTPQNILVSAYDAALYQEIGIP